MMEKIADGTVIQCHITVAHHPHRYQHPQAEGKLQCPGLDGSTTFILVSAARGMKKINVSPMRCPLLYSPPEEVDKLIKDGWRVIGHIDNHADGHASRWPTGEEK